MKTFLEKWVLLLAVLLVGGACDDKKDPQPSGSLLPQFWEVMSQGGYWSEDVRFVYLEDGQVHISDKDIAEEYSSNIAGGSSYPNDVLMEQFYYDPATYYIRRYVLVSKRDEEPVYRYHSKRFWMGPEASSENGFFISPVGKWKYERSAMSEVYTNLISVSADEIVMEVPIKSFIYDNWMLDHYGGGAAPLRSYLRLRTTWRRITDPERLAQLESATPFDEEPTQQ